MNWRRPGLRIYNLNGVTNYITLSIGMQVMPQELMLILKYLFLCRQSHFPLVVFERLDQVEL